MRGFQRQAELCRDASRAVLAEQAGAGTGGVIRAACRHACMHMQQIKIELSMRHPPPPPEMGLHDLLNMATLPAYN